MPRLLRMPGVAADSTEATLTEWLVSEGDELSSGAAVATVETDKALVDIEAEEAGVVLRTLVGSGTSVAVGAPIAVLGDAGEQVEDLDAILRDLGVDAPAHGSGPDAPSSPEPGVAGLVGPPTAGPATPHQASEGGSSSEEADSSSEPPSPSGAQPQPDGQQPTPGQPPTREPAPGPAGSPSPVRHGGRVFASPLARRLARDAGLPIEEIPGTGPRHRVLRRDVEAALAQRASEPAAAPAPEAEPAPTTAAPAAAAYTDTPHTPLRRKAAARLTASKQEAPHFYLRRTVRMERLLALRAELVDEAGLKVSVNDLVVKAVAAAHLRVPEMNVVWTDDAVRSFSAADVAVAVATDRGLVTPVVTGVESRTLADLIAAVRDLVERARAGRLRQHELEGGSITVTNLGMFGVDEFAAIINPPHAAILAVGAVREEPVVEDGAVVPGRVMTLTLSVDHRPVDGVVAARWIDEVVSLLERPVRLLV